MENLPQLCNWTTIWGQRTCHCKAKGSRRAGDKRAGNKHGEPDEQFLNIFLPEKEENGLIVWGLPFCQLMFFRNDWIESSIIARSRKTWRWHPIFHDLRRSQLQLELGLRLLSPMYLWDIVMDYPALRHPDVKEHSAVQRCGQTVKRRNVQYFSSKYVGKNSQVVTFLHTPFLTKITTRECEVRQRKVTQATPRMRDLLFVRTETSISITKHLCRMCAVLRHKLNLKFLLFNNMLWLCPWLVICAHPKLPVYSLYPNSYKGFLSNLCLKQNLDQLKQSLGGDSSLFVRDACFMKQGDKLFFRQQLIGASNVGQDAI